MIVFNAAGLRSVLKRFLLAPGLHVDVLALPDIVGLEALPYFGHEGGVVGQAAILHGGRNGQNDNEAATDETHNVRTPRRHDGKH